jgi:hypothetical protein
MAISVASPISNAAPRTTFRLAKWFDFEGGPYTIKAVADDAAFFYASIEAGNARAAFSLQLGQGVVQGTVYLPRGRYRLDIALSNLTTTPSPCYAAFSLWRDGNLVYASDADGWVFDTSPIPDLSVPSAGDPRLALRVFSLLPNWANGVTERIEWLSEVMPSEADVEQRRSQRRFPRRSFEASFFRHDIARARLDAFLTGAGRDPVLVPLWHEQYRITTTLGLTLSFPQDSLAMREFFAGDLVIVMHKDPLNYEILRVQSVNLATDTITFAAAPTRTWGAGARIMPLRTGRMLEPASMQSLTDTAATAQIRLFLVEHLKWPAPSWGGCSALFRFDVNRATPLTLSFDRSTHTIDNEFGLIEVTDASFQTRGGTRLALILRGRRSVFRFRQFIAQARGRTTRFWMPTLSQDLTAAGNFSASYFDVKNIGFADYVRSAQDLRSTVAIKFNNGRGTVYRRITTVVEVAGNERVFVTPDIPPITLAEVERIEFMVPSRFDQDAFELQHPVDDSAVVQVGLVMRSSTVTGMPPLECVTTSKPYPVHVLEQMGSTAEFVIGTLKEPQRVLEEVRVAAEFVSGLLGAPFVAYAGAPEPMQIEAEFIGGTIDDFSASFSVPPEGFGTESEFVDGTLINLVLSYTGQHEMMQSSAEFIEGTLA